MARVTLRTKRIRYAADAPPRSREDVLAVEEPLQIRVRGHGEPSTSPPRELSVTMRTPGHDFDLVAGFLVGEGVLRRAEEIVTMRYCAGTDEQGRQTFNVVDVVLAEGVTPPAARQLTTTSACGICGTTSIDEVLKAAPPWGLGDPDAGLIDVALLLALPERLRAAQPLFERTGGVHAAGLFTATGELLCVREDVGRHNAVDKVLGWALRDGRLPLAGTVLQVSGRASFELVQKARQGGIPVLAAVGAASSLAVELAEQAGLTLVGFSRGTSANAYTHPGRVAAVDPGS